MRCSQQTRLQSGRRAGLKAAALLVSGLLMSPAILHAFESPVNMDLLPTAGTPGAWFVGMECYDEVGHSVSGIGDFNGDGIEDFAIGAPERYAFFCGRFGETGEAYIMFGSASGVADAYGGQSLDDWSLDINGDGETDGIRIDGHYSYESTGWSLSGVGDVNGDGLDDVVVTTMYETPSIPSRSGSAKGMDKFAGRESRGGIPPRAYLIHGSSDDFPSTSTIQLSNLQTDSNYDGRIDGVVLEASYGFPMFGFGASGLGDVNGDGFDDFAIASPNSGMAFGRGGAGGRGIASDSLFIIYGGPGGVNSGSAPFMMTDIDGSNGTRIAFSGPQISFTSVSGAGDVNGDGFDDVLVGSKRFQYYPSDRGYSALIFGSATGVPAGSYSSFIIDTTMSPSQGIIFDGPDGDDVGIFVGAAGDVNGDGFDDLMIGAPALETFNTDYRPASGLAYLVYGRPDLGSPSDIIFDLQSLDGTNGAVLRGGAFDDAGFRVGSPGDVDGDGFSDITVSAPYTDYSGGKRKVHRGGGDYFGETHLVFGGVLASTQPDLVELATNDLPNGVRFDAEEPYDAFGHAVRGAGDVNKDGISDMIFGSRFYSYGGGGGKREGDTGGEDRGSPYASSGVAYVVYGQDVVTSSPTYLANVRTGSAPLRKVGAVRDGSHSIPFSRAEVGFDGGHGADDPSSASLTMARLYRSKPVIDNYDPNDVANVYWEITSDRVGYSTMFLKLYYLESEIASVNEFGVELLYSPDGDPSTYTPIVGLFDRPANSVEGFATAGGFFALAAPPVMIAEVNNFALIPISPGKGMVMFSEEAGTGIQSYKIEVSESSLPVFERGAVGPAKPFYSEVINVASGPPPRNLRVSRDFAGMWPGTFYSSKVFNLPLNVPGLITSWEGNYKYEIKAYSGPDATGFEVNALGQSFVFPVGIPSTDMVMQRPLFNMDNSVTLNMVDYRPTGDMLDFSYDFFQQTYGPTQNTSIFKSNNGRTPPLDVTDVGTSITLTMSYTPPAGDIAWYGRSRNVYNSNQGDRMGNFDIGFISNVQYATILPASAPPSGSTDTDRDGFGDGIEVALDTNPNNAHSVPNFGDCNNDGVLTYDDYFMLYAFISPDLPVLYNPRLDILADGKLDRNDTNTLFFWLSGRPGYEVIPRSPAPRRKPKVEASHGNPLLESAGQ